MGKRATAFVSPAGVGAGADDSTTPRLVLVHGSMPGGSCGIWGRSLCINVSTLEGAMYDYIARAHERGWIVIVADPFSDLDSPHRHMLELSNMMLMKGGPVMIVGHSYGAAMSIGMLKGNSASLQPYVTALALTDGMVWGAEGWTSENLLDERPPTDSELTATGATGDALKERRQHRDRLIKYAKHAPDAFRPGNAEDRAFLKAVGRNWVASALPVGAKEPGGGGGGGGGGGASKLMPTVSAGHEAHPSTTFTATEDVFAFLDRAARRRRKRAHEP